MASELFIHDDTEGCCLFYLFGFCWFMQADDAVLVCENRGELDVEKLL